MWKTKHEFTVVFQALVQSHSTHSAHVLCIRIPCSDNKKADYYHLLSIYLIFLIPSEYARHFQYCYLCIGLFLFVCLTYFFRELQLHECLQFFCGLPLSLRKVWILWHLEKDHGEFNLSIFAASSVTFLSFLFLSSSHTCLVKLYDDHTTFLSWNFTPGTTLPFGGSKHSPPFLIYYIDNPREKYLKRIESVGHTM